MEQIKVIFFAIASFFGIEDGRIAAEKTIITVYPKKKQIEVVQEGLFSIIQSEKDSVLVSEQWNELLEMKEGHANWSKELDGFPVKNFDLISKENVIQPRLLLSYSEENDLRSLGIWYNESEKYFSINHVPLHNIKTSDGNLEGNYWVFKGQDKFSFTLEPFIKIPDKYLKLKKPLNELISTGKK